MRDPGLQPERTQQAWSRTLLLLFINACLFLRTSLLDSSWLMLVGSILAILLFALIASKRLINSAYKNIGLMIDSALFLVVTSITILIMSILFIIHLFL
ncbi:DUF202 domain-containing protein [Providencia sneebia]|uniref:DUF202 domain-containing protein n=1 Tax=Providencia sneebia DSM 19967 TaxID=1141660 RepID=K8WJ25_9GAMM|nr:hypothetical protein OO7_03909 [Providencia sneebia DSM 19967]